jgi:hypothetical protein
MQKQKNGPASTREAEPVGVKSRNLATEKRDRRGLQPRAKPTRTASMRRDDDRSRGRLSVGVVTASAQNYAAFRLASPMATCDSFLSVATSSLRVATSRVTASVSPSCCAQVFRVPYRAIS